MADSKKGNQAEHYISRAPLPGKTHVSVGHGDAAKHEESLLDEALDETFPASDPISNADATVVTQREAEISEEEEIIEHEEFLLDEALELTFPASDPVAIPDPETVAKAVHRIEREHHRQ